MPIIVYDLTHKKCIKSKDPKRKIKLTTIPEPRYNLRPRRTKPTSATPSQTPDISCIICLDTSTEGGQKVFSPCCQRSFHSVCLMSWCSGKDTPICPLCRKEIPKVKVLVKVTHEDGDELMTETFGYVIE